MPVLTEGKSMARGHVLFPADSGPPAVVCGACKSMWSHIKMVPRRPCPAQWAAMLLCDYNGANAVKLDGEGDDD